MAYSTILIADGREQYRSMMQRALENADCSVAVCHGPPWLDSIREQAPSWGRFELLLDFDLGSDLFSELAGYKKFEGRIRTWIVTGAPDVDVGGLREDYPVLNIQLRWFDKTSPGFTEEITEAIRRGETGFHALEQAQRGAVISPLQSSDHNRSQNHVSEALQSLGILNEWFDDLPEPIRVIDRHGEVVSWNREWAGNPYTPPINHSRLTSLLNEKNPQWHEESHWGPLPQTDDQSDRPHLHNTYYRLRERAIRTRDESRVLVQWLTPLTAGHDLKGTVTKILAEMVRIHFTRARFFRILPLPGFGNILSLEQQTGGILYRQELPIRRKLTGKLKQQVRDYKGIEIQDRLAYKQSSVEKLGKERELWRHEIVGMEGVTDFIRVPVRDFQEGSEVRILGFLACDCKDRGEGKVPDEAMKWLEHYLTDAMRSLSKLILEEERAKRLEGREVVQEALNHLLAANSVESFEELLLQKAKDITDSEGGVLVTNPPGNERQLEVRGIIGKPAEYAVKRIDVGERGWDRELKVWRKGEIISEQQFRSSTRFSKMTIVRGWERLAEPDKKQVMKDWLEQNAGSFVAAPLRRGSKVIGAIYLYHRQELHFDADRIFRLRGLLDIAAQLLERQREREDRIVWMHQLIHRVGGRISNIANNLDVMASLSPDEQKECLDKAHKESKLLRELVARERDSEHRWELRGDFPLDWERRFSTVWQQIERQTKDICGIIEQNATQHDLNPVLRGDSGALDMLLRDLITNACQHGEDLQPVHIAQSVQDRYWQLQITNTGKILEEDREEIFRPDRRGTNAKGDGLGLGLNIARDTARLHDGDLSLEDDGNESGAVTFRLRWPVAVPTT